MWVRAKVRALIRGFLEPIKAIGPLHGSQAGTTTDRLSEWTTQCVQESGLIGSGQHQRVREGRVQLPIITIRWLVGRTPEQKAAIAAAMTSAIVEIGRASGEATHVIFEDIAHSNWAQGGILKEDAAKRDQSTA